MSFKHLITSTCMALVLSGSICLPANARHVTNDPAANVLDAGILVQDLMAVVLKVSDLAEFVKRNLSFGDLGAITSGLDYTKNIENLVSKVNVSAPQLPDTLSDLESAFTTATADAGKMKALIDSALPSSSEEQELTTKDKAEQLAFRQAIHKAAITDAYATAVAYQTNKTKAGEEVVQPAQQVASGAETQQEKQAAANEVGLARLNELIENNVLTASMLQLQAAEAMANLPVDA